MTPAELLEGREKLGLTQRALEAIMGYRDRKGGTISDMECGRTQIDPRAARLLRAYLDGYRPADWPAGK